MHFDKFWKKFSILSLLLILIILTTIKSAPSADLQAAPSISASTDKTSYHLRQAITISGDLTLDGSPITNALVALELKDPRDNAFYVRTVPIGNPLETWAFDITDFTLKDLSETQITKTTPNSEVKAYVTIKNNFLNPLDVAIVITICDENLIPIYCGSTWATVEGGDYTTSTWFFQVPEWAKPGKTFVFMNVFNDLPENQGVPYAPEETAYFYIVRNPELEPSYSIPKATYASSAGRYEAYLTAPPDRYTRPGTYAIHVTGRVSPAVRVYSSATFEITSYACPPQAAFTYSPLQIYQNMTATLDASSSSAEGFNDTIIRYEWTINDPYNPEKIIRQGSYTNPPSPIASHTFEYPGAFVVELNVTDNEGMWSTTAKPIPILPEFGPTANFTWLPPLPMINETITFDASNSKTGWSAAIQGYSPITTYDWDFDDGTLETTPDPTITHNYTDLGNFTVTLTITDSVGRTDTISQRVEVLNITLKACDVNGDGFIDIKDLLAAALAYGSEPGDPNWDPRCDINGDKFIDIKDILTIAMHFGEDP